MAARPIEDEKRKLWYRHNALEPTRPVIFCDPENGWNEVITQQQIECEGDLARGWEMSMRKEIFWADSMGDDRVVDAVFEVRHVYDESEDSELPGDDEPDDQEQWAEDWEPEGEDRTDS